MLTHGHFDHVGVAARRWPSGGTCRSTPTALELPYLTGRSAYPPPDPTVGGGLMALPVAALPARADRPAARASAPCRTTARAGHARLAVGPHAGPHAGHVSLFRDADRALIAGDAFVTTKQESLTPC